MSRPMSIQSINPPGRQGVPPKIATYAAYGPYGSPIAIDPLPSDVTIAGVSTSTGNAVTVYLPNPSTVPAGRRVLVQDVGGNAGTANITIAPNGGTIHGDVVITTNYGAREYVTNGTDWFLCGIVI